MAQEGIYKNPIILNSDTHKTFKVRKVEDYGFAQELNSSLITGHEFIEVSKYYPIVFASGRDNNIVPLAVLGLRDKSNLFIGDSGKWIEGVYVPAFIRRYPFILSESDPNGQNFTISVDADYAGFNNEEGMSLFDEEGNTSTDMNNIIEFLRQYHMQNMLTQEFVKKLVEYDLLKDFAADITMPAGEKVGFRGMKMVNEKTLLELDDEKSLELFRRGFLGWIYGHLFSLSNFKALAAHEAKKSTTEKAA